MNETRPAPSTGTDLVRSNPQHQPRNKEDYMSQSNGSSPEAGAGANTTLYCSTGWCGNEIDPVNGPVCEDCLSENPDTWDRIEANMKAEFEREKKAGKAKDRLDRFQDKISSTSSLEDFYASANDSIKLKYESTVQETMLRAYAQRAAREALLPPANWADLGSIRSQGRPERVPPSVMEYSENPFEGAEETGGLFYPAAINTIFGNAEVGKSLLNYATHAREINKGNHTVHMDFDNNTAEEAFWRVVDSGADEADVEQFFHVIEMPDKVPVFDFAPTFVSLDSVNAAVSFLGLEANSSGIGVDTVFQTYLMPFVAQGACALALDHVGHGDKTRATNSIRKIQAISGIAYCMEVVGDGGKIGEKWYSKLTPTKDRPGAGPAKGLVAAYIEFDGTIGRGLCEVTVRKELAGGDRVAIPDDITDADSRLLFGIVSSTVDSALTTAEIFKDYEAKGGDNSLSTVKRALGILRQEGKISGEKINPKQKTSGWKYFAADNEALPEETPFEEGVRSNS